jgi:serine protease Do
MRTMTNEQLHDLVDTYCLGNLNPSEIVSFEAEMANSPALQKMVSEHKAFLRLLNHRTAKALIGNQLNMIRHDNKNKLHNIADELKIHINKYWKTASVAASVALIASTFTFMIARTNYEKQFNNTVLGLKRELKNDVKRIETKQNAIAKKVADKMPEQPSGQSKAAGTCFAINNKGYAITNAHVIGNSKSIFIFTSDNVAHKAMVVAQDADLDIAVLKIDEEHFKFSTADIPYSISNNNSSMAQKIYTLGFPKNSVVYNEGYISSIYGRDDDSSRYQMELPSSPGVSGSPVFDEKGNIVAVINNKESVSEGITYALKSKKLNKFIKSLDTINANGGNALNGLTRTEQIKKINDFVLVVQVY